MIEDTRDCFLLAANTYVWRRADFDFVGPFGELPVLQDQISFDAFCREYAVFRGGELLGGTPLRAAARVALKNLQEPLSVVKATQCCDLKTDPKGTLRRDWSGVSKLLWLWQPEKFAPWDQYARAGLIEHTDCPDFRDPDDYIREFDKALAGWSERDRVLALIDGCDLSDKSDLLLRATFDVFLMHKGNRWR